MRILIVGSIRHSSDKDQRRKFQAACSAIGRILAAHRHTLILGSDNKQTADWYVAEGVSTLKGTHKIEVFYSGENAGKVDPSERTMPFHDDGASALSHLDIKVQHGDGPWAVAHGAAIVRADLVIVIGGGERSGLVAQFASAFNRPVLAIPCFGGTAQKIWTQFSSSYRAGGITEKDRELISREWTTDSAKSVLKIATILMRTRPKLSSWGAQTMLLVSAIAASSLWAYLLSPAHHWFLDGLGALYIQQICAAIDGIVFRTSFRMLRDDGAEIAPFRVWVELLVAISLSFGLLLFFFLDDFVVTGSVDTLTDATAFERISIALSLITLAASATLEEATKKLVAKLSSHI